MCDDCLWATQLNEATVDYSTLPWRLNSDAYKKLSSADLSYAVAYCTATGPRVDRCDFVQDFHDSLTLGPVTVFGFVLMLLLSTIVGDLDRHSEIQDVFEYRLWNGKYNVSLLASFMAAMINSTRRFVMPGAVVFAYCALVLTGPIFGFAQPVYFIVSGVVVGVIYHAERLCAMVFLDNQAVKQTREAFANESVRANIQSRKHLVLHSRGMAWWDHRLYAVCLGVVAFLVIMGTNSLMDVIPFWDMPKIWSEGKVSKIPGDTNNCSNLVIMLALTIAAAVVCYTLLWTVSTLISSGCKFCSMSVVFAPVNVLMWLLGIWAILLTMVYAPVLNPTP
jgi:hypothetical protein